MTDNTQWQKRREQHLKKRHAAERRFHLFGVGAILLGLSVLFFMLSQIIVTGIGTFRQTYIVLEVNFDAQVLGIPSVEEPYISFANVDGVVRKALRAEFPEVTERAQVRELYGLLSLAAGSQVFRALKAKPALLNQQRTLRLLADDTLDMYMKGKATNQLSPRQIAWAETLHERKKIRLTFNRSFFTEGDSSEPEQAGIKGALIGSAFTMLVTLFLSFPLGVAAAIYLEEFAGKSRFRQFIDVNINNLAAVPPIIYGLLGLAVFINVFGMPRSVPLVAGFVLSLMTLPTIIIASRSALQAVPRSIREAALGIGASKMQVLTGHVFVLALPGMLTGTIIGMSRALGETAPLLLIGMVAFIVDIPSGLQDPATVLPVQIYLWSEAAELAFVERTSAAILVMLLFLMGMNGIAVWIRHRVEKHR